MSEADASRIPYLRRKKIMELLAQNEILSIEAIQQALSPCSESTVRRDLGYLEQEKLVTLLRGGAVKLADSEFVELPVAEKVRLNMDRKERIAKFAATLVEDGEIIYIDSGTTTALMARHLQSKDITIVTSNTSLLADADKQRGVMIMLGGEVSKTIASVSGPMTDRQLSEMFFNRAFLGASGISLNGGVNTFDLREASKKSIVLKNSEKTYVLADGTKAGRSTMCKAFNLRDCILITDEENDVSRNANALIAE